MDLVIDQDGVHFSTNVSSFEQVCINLFDKGISSTQSVPQLEKYVMEDLNFTGTPLLESVGEHEPPVEELRNTTRHALKCSLIPLISYSKEYEQFVDLLNLDVNAYCREYNEKEHSAQEVQADVEKHLTEKDRIESILPNNIVIGPYYLNTEGVRQAISKKCKALSNALLELLAAKLRKQADEACEEFKFFARKLYEKPNCIEELAEMREWMKTIPDKLKEHQELIDKAMVDYELIEAFYYNLSQEDFNTKWTTVGWPHKIELQMAQTYEQLEEEEEKFHKLQLSDQTTFNDKLDSLSMAVAGLAGYTDLSRAHEIANEVRRLHKQLKEAQEQAAIYNNRERLFGMPVTNVSVINTVIFKKYLKTH